MDHDFDMTLRNRATYRSRETPVEENESSSWLASPVAASDTCIRQGKKTMTHDSTSQSGSGGTTGQMTEQARQQGQQVAQKARYQASRLGEQAWGQAKSQVGTQKDRMSRQLDSVAQVLHQSGQQLREQGQGTIGQYADRASDQLSRVSGYLHDRNPDQLLHDAERFARQRPAIFLGGAFTAGLLAARFLKSSAQDGGSGGDSGGTRTVAGTSASASQGGTGIRTRQAGEG